MRSKVFKRSVRDSLHERFFNEGFVVPTIQIGIFYTKDFYRNI